MSDQPLHGSWWQASDGKWYPPEQHPNTARDLSTEQVPTTVVGAAQVPPRPSTSSGPPAPPRATTIPGFTEPSPSPWRKAGPWVGVAFAGLLVMMVIGALVGDPDEEILAGDTAAAAVEESTTTTRPTTTTTSSTTTTTTTTTTSTTTTAPPPPPTTAPPPPPPTTAAPPPPPPPTTAAPPPAPVPPAPVPAPSAGSAYYKNCDAVRAAGAAPIHVGQPGYAKHLDRDGDGIGCE